MTLNGISQADGVRPSVGEIQPAGPAAPGFKEALRQELEGLKFSAHAQQRLKQRQVDLGADQVQRLESAVNKASAKGSNESLVLLGDLAFVVSVKNKVVVTVLDGESQKSHVFTGIDSAVIG